jgi:two-component system CheB/CheR fusion protein
VTHLAGAFQDVTARRALSAQADRLSLVARQMTNAVVITDARSRLEWVNEAFTRMSGYTLEDLRGRRPAEVLYGPDTDETTLRYMAAQARRGEGYEVELVHYGRSGRAYWMSLVCSPIRDEQGELGGFIAVGSDITSRKRAEQAAGREAAERGRAEALLRDILDSLPIAVSAYDAAERLILTNRCFAETLPLIAPVATKGMTLEDMAQICLSTGQFSHRETDPAARQAWVAAQLKTLRAANATRTAKLPSGRYVQTRESRSAAGTLICVCTDMTELKRAEQALRVQANQDALTMLANRTAMLRALGHALQPGAGGATGGALILLDVDYFKQVNDTIGHDAGDALLMEIAARLRAVTRAGDTPARLGGDEFAVLLPGLTGEEGAAARISQIHATLSKPVLFRGHQLHAGISAGMTLFPADGADAPRLMKNADLALYEAKRTGRGRWCRYRPEQACSLEHHVHLADSLRRALAAGTLDVALQPKWRLDGGHDGFEALARWYDDGRWVPPGEFVPVAEDSGQITALGEAVLNIVLGRVRSLRDMGLAPGRVAINLGGAQLLDGRFRAGVTAALAHFGLGPDCLEFELTETVLLGRALDRVEQVLHEFRAMGIVIALDDFGTGFAALSHVLRLPIQRLKIDRAFTTGIGNAGRGAVIARAVIGLAHGMDMEAVAVGVETQEQLTFLAAEGCDSVQGRLISPPLLTVAEIAGYLQKARQRSVALA